MANLIPLDKKENLHICDCEFVPDSDNPEEEPCSYLRQCAECGAIKLSNHCPHDGFQGRCSCGARLPQVEDKSE